MSVDMKLLAAHGVSSGAYKKIFTQDPVNYPTKVKNLVYLISNRLRDGYEQGLRDYKAYYAVDLAYEVPFNQTTPTLIQNIVSKNLSHEQTVEALKTYGLSMESLFLEVPVSGGKGLKLNLPVFFNVYVPIVKAYVSAIQAFIFNERNLSPLLKYNPLKNTTKNRILCEIITDIAQEMATWYGYPSVLRQSIQQMLKYGTMIAFPQEEWHSEEQIRTDEAGNEVRFTVKEGIRYAHPHPTRMYIDQRFPPSSINTDSGCLYGGHWHILTYGEVFDNPNYWNRRSIFGGTNWFSSPLAGNYFQEVFPCRLKFPERWTSGVITREDKKAYYSSSNDRDKAVFVTDHFEKIVPKDWGLGDYKYPVWHRFKMAGDDTVIWAEPCAYNPMWWMGYDWDETMSRSPSFALELIPWQDHIGNILTQMILTAKQNLANVVFYNETAVNKEDIERMRNLGEEKYRSTQYIGYNPLQLSAMRTTANEIFTSVQLSKVGIQELLQLVPTVLNIMERVLGISAQVAGSAASHQQSKEEVSQTGGASQQRIGYMSAPVDEAEDAWKRQLYDGAMAYKDPEFVAEISADIEYLDKYLKELGFEVSGDNELHDRKVVKGSKKKLRLEGFAASNQGPQRDNDKEVAQVLMSTIQVVAGQEDLRQQLGPKKILKLIETAAILGGAPRDFKLGLDPDAEKNGEVPKAILEAIQKAQQATLQAVEQKIAQPIAKEMAGEQQEILQIQEALKKLQGIYEIAAKTQDKNAIQAKESQAEEARKQQAFQADERRKEEKHQLDMNQAREKAGLSAAVQMHQAHVSADVKRAQAEAAAKSE